MASSTYQDVSYGLAKAHAFSKNLCLICGEGNDELNLGKLHNLQVFTVHYLCVLTGHNLYPSGSAGKREGLLGFLLEDIYSAFKRYKTIVCVYCNKFGASIECIKCQINYHLPCGIRNEIIVEMMGDFKSYCKDCHSVTILKGDPKNYSCVICHNPPKEKTILYWPQCCKPSSYFIDSDCLKHYAQSAGYLMKCPLCSNRKTFRNTVREFGVFIPDIDAQWLVEEEQELVFYPLRCSFNFCIIKSKNYIRNIVFPCVACGQKMAHLECTFSRIFMCSDCSLKLYANFDKEKLISEQLGLHVDFPWIYPVLETLKREKVYMIVRKINRLLIERFRDMRIVKWYAALEVEESDWMIRKIREHYRDFVRRNMRGGRATSSKRRRCY